MKIIRKAALGVFKDKKILMARSFGNEHAFYFVGGGIDEGETAEQAAEREVKEEIDCEVKPGSLQLLGEFEAPAYGKESMLVNITLFTGTLVGAPTPSSEVEEIGWFDSKSDARAFTPITEQIFEFLKAKNLIN